MPDVEMGHRQEKHLGMEIQKEPCNLNLHLYSTVSNALPVTGTYMGEGGKSGQETQAIFCHSVCCCRGVK